MYNKTQNTYKRPGYTSPECTVVILGDVDIVTASSIYLPMQPLYDDASEHYFNTPGLIID